jgi:hypothetical protein
MVMVEIAPNSISLICREHREPCRVFFQRLRRKNIHRRLSDDFQSDKL